MSGWNDIVLEMGKTPTQLDYVRRRYIKELEEKTGRNVITYYSAWLSKNCPFIDIDDADMEGFMNAVQGLDFNLGLDLILHTPGGSPAAAESIVQYLKSIFKNDIRVIVPHLAMSAGTMISCSSKEIIMGKHSSLGPIDPQFNGIPAYNIKSEFEEAKEDLAINPHNANYWALKLQQYPAAFLKTALDAIDLSGTLVREWLGSNMFDADIDKDQIDTIVNFLNEHDNSKIHGRHFNIDTCKSIGLNIRELESDNELQDRILSVHHSSMLTFDNSDAIKIIENKDKSFIKTSNNVV